MNLSVYLRAHDDMVWRDMSHFGRFRVGGKDAAALLHHLTTNDIKKLRVGQSCEAALVSSKARLLDVVSVLRRADDFLVITSPNRRAMFAPHLQSFVLYRQDVQIEDITEKTSSFGAFGNNLKSIEIDNNNSIHTKRLPLNGAIYTSDSHDDLTQIVSQSGAPLCDNETYNILRVESGVPVAGLELTEAVNPWEANLNAMISLHKGCYNGQEIVARLNTYQKVKQRLRGVRLQHIVGEMPAKLSCDDKEAGWISSCVESPQFGAIGLAYVRGDFANAGQKLQIEDTTATVCDLPFIARN